MPVVGDWRNWLAHTLRVRGVVGSSPASPTIQTQTKPPGNGGFRLGEEKNYSDKKMEIPKKPIFP